MPRRCAFNCEPSDVPMHRFPNFMKFPAIFRACVSLIGGKLESASDYEYYREKRVCDIHFSDRHRRGTNRLFKEAVPEQFVCPVVLEQEQSQPPICTSPPCTLPTNAIPICTPSCYVQLEHNYCAASRTRSFSKARHTFNMVQPLHIKIKQLRSMVSAFAREGNNFKRLHIY